MTQVRDNLPVSDATTASSTYIASRPSPDGPVPDNVVVHRVQLGADASSAPAASTLRFPRPENIWMSRDVDRADWTAFGKQLLGRKRPGATTKADDEQKKLDDEKTDEATRRQRISDLVSQWNTGFFEPRGLKILAQFGDETAEDAPSAAEGDAKTVTGGSEANGQQQSRGYGLKLGNSLFGVSLPPHSHGYGLRLGGVLLGVRVDDDDDEKK